MPVTLRMVKREGVPVTIYKFAMCQNQLAFSKQCLISDEQIPLGTLVNMDGTGQWAILRLKLDSAS